MKMFLGAIVAVAVSSCSAPNNGPEFTEVAGSLVVHGMWLGSTTTEKALQERQVADCSINETLAPITGPVDYCRLRKTEFLGAETTAASVHFDDGRLGSLHINAPSEAFRQYVGRISAALGEPTSPKPNDDGTIPHGEANMTDAEGRHVISDYRIWKTPVAYVSLYEFASGKTGELALMITKPA